MGLYLKNNLKFSSTILCTGGAISFFTKDQAPINDFIDKFYLGWLIRLIFNPLIFFKRYFFGLKLIPMVIFSKIKLLNEVNLECYMYWVDKIITKCIINKRFE